jgi:hypothetical protein
MGHIIHHAIIVTSFDHDALSLAWIEASELGMSVTDVVSAPVGPYYSFMAATDGSKSGWPESDKGDKQRADLKEYIRAQAYDDGTNALEWVEVSYGSDDREAKVVDHQHAATTEAA